MHIILFSSWFGSVMQADLWAWPTTRTREILMNYDAVGSAISIACACPDHTHTACFWLALSENHHIALKPFSVGGKVSLQLQDVVVWPIGVH